MIPVRSKLCLAAGLTPLLAATVAFGAFSTPADAVAEGKTRLVAVPTATLGNVREIFVKRADKKIRDVLSFAGRIKVLRDTDRPPKHLKPKAKAPVVSKAAKQIAEAGRLRLEGMDLARKKKYRRAYRRFIHATQLYEKYFAELVDYNNMADAYARAAVAAWHGWKKKDNVRFLFTNGIVLQPTLVIDRRKADADLLKLFDKLHAQVKTAKKYAIHVKSKKPVKDAIVFIDGKRAGPIPARRGGLLSGYHYVMVRHPDYKPWGRQVRIRGKDAHVKAALKPIKKKRKKAPLKELVFDDLGWCRNTGNFHDKKCKALSKRMGEQTAASHLLFTALKSDRYGRLSLHPFLMRADKAQIVALPVIELGKNMRKLNADMPKLEDEVSKRIAKWPKARVLKKRPRAFD